MKFVQWKRSHKASYGKPTVVFNVKSRNDIANPRRLRVNRGPTMKSMTGYGRGECSQRGFKVTVEVSSVNRKQTEIAVNLPRELEVLEAQIARRDQPPRGARTAHRARLRPCRRGRLRQDAHQCRAGQDLRPGTSRPGQVPSPARRRHAGPAGARAGCPATGGGNHRGGGTLAGDGQGAATPPWTSC